jgi:hypothetical protein
MLLWSERPFFIGQLSKPEKSSNLRMDHSVAGVLNEFDLTQWDKTVALPLPMLMFST